MRHIYFCAALGVVALVGSASFAAQSYVSPDLRYSNFPATQAADAGGTADSGIIKCSYDSPSTCGGCSTCADCCATDCATGCGASCVGGYDWREAATSAGWIGGFEFVWLKPHFSEGFNYHSSTTPGQAAQTGIDASEDYGFQTDYNLAPRVWIGYQCCSGFAARLRYWQFDHGLGSYALETTAENYYFAPSTFGGLHFLAASTGDRLAVQNGLKADVIDFDLTQDFNWRHTRLSLGGGLSYAGLRMDRNLALITATSVATERRTSRFQGIGPSVLAELKRQIGSSGISIVGGVRGTVLFGRERIFAEYVSTGQVDERETNSLSTNRCRGIVAASIGVQYDYEVCSGTDAFGRLSWEGQYWNGFGNPVGDGGDLAFQGLGIAFGLRR